MLGFIGKIFKKKEGGTNVGNALRAIFGHKPPGTNESVNSPGPNSLADALKNNPALGGGGDAEALKKYGPMAAVFGAFMLLLVLLKG